MEVIIFLEIILGFLCLLGLITVVIFFVRKNNNDIEVDTWIENANKQMTNDLKTLEEGNKKIDEIENKILVCKKKLNIKLFDK